MKTRYVFSYNGGGARGYFSAWVTQYIDNCLMEKGRSICGISDLLSGTSTGGLIAICKSLGMTYHDIILMYEKWLPYIFEKSFWRKGLTDEIYKTDNVEEAFNEVLGDQTTGDCTTPVMITTCLGYERHVHVFASHSIGNIENRGDFYLKDIARATSAAPVFFEPCRITSVDGAITYDCFDGGLGRNDPSLMTYLAAKKQWPNDPIRICVIGTGIANRPITYDETKDWGAPSWVMLNGCPLISMLMGYQQDSIKNDLENLIELFPNDQLLYIDTALTKANDDMDDVSANQLNRLRELAEISVSNIHESVLNSFFQLY
tara:strand:+ start:3308 stop:4258 length:951 start_codon:yes stop_codon:yes gene_type:complete